MKIAIFGLIQLCFLASLLSVARSAPVVDERKQVQAMVNNEKLYNFYLRLGKVDNKTLLKGLVKLFLLQEDSTSKDEFLEAVWKDSQNPDQEEFEQFKKDFDEMKTALESRPEILEWVEQYLTNGLAKREGLKKGEESFEETFAEVDAEMADNQAWNRFWTYWFKISADYVAKYG